MARQANVFFFKQTKTFYPQFQRHTKRKEVRGNNNAGLRGDVIDVFLLTNKSVSK